MKKKSQNLEFENAKFLVGKFLKFPKSANWAQEIFIAKKLLPKYKMESNFGI